LYDEHDWPRFDGFGHRVSGTGGSARKQQHMGLILTMLLGMGGAWLGVLIAG
jgi:hypothetical protein